MQCTKCGAQLPDGSSYCNICGKKQQAAAAAEKKRKTSYYADKRQKQRIPLRGSDASHLPVVDGGNAFRAFRKEN